MIPTSLNELYTNVPTMYDMNELEIVDDCEYGLQVFLMTLNIPVNHIISEQSEEVLLSDRNVKILITCTSNYDGTYFYTVEYMFNV